MNSLTDTFRLSNGVEIPCVGFGTWQAKNGSEARKSVEWALAAGYRHIDTAAGYQNEESVGAAVRNSGIDRATLFITSKLQNEEHGYDKTMKAFERTMKKLAMDYLDLYLIHWPNPIAFRNQWQQTNAGSWKAFEELYRAGRIRSIGVSNFHPRHIDELLKTAEIVPMVNQIRLCPGDTQDDVVDYCRAKGILLEAYSPLGTGRIFDVPEMQAFARKYNKTVAQICVRWSLQMGFLPLPKSVTEARIRENADVFDFSLSDEDVKAIAGMKGVCGYSANPDTTTW